MGARVLEVLPKVEMGDGVPKEGRGIFLRLLGLSGALKVFTDGNASHDLRRQSLLDVFIAAYFDALTTLIRRGLLRRYQSREEDLNLIRGRLLVGRQATALAMRPDRLACRFDELTADNEWNRGLKAALNATRPWISTIALGRRWTELSATLDEVSQGPVTPEALDALTFDRQAAHYKTAIQWAAWILRVLTPSLRVGRNEAPSLIFDMNRLFESAVTTVLRRRALVGGVVDVNAQETGAHLATLVGCEGKPVFRLRPDIVLRRAGKVVAVGDTKWRCVEVDRDGYLMPSEAHIYQMQAYASGYDCEQLTLIYPWHRGLIGSKPTVFALQSIGGRNPVVSVACVDVNSDDFKAVGGTSDSEFGRLLQ